MTELLIIKPSSLGDIVQGLQVATSLKAQREHLRISWIVREMFAPLVRACEAVDRVYVFERTAGAKGFLQLMREVRKTKFDYVFDLQGLLRTGLMTSRARAKHKVGRADAREGAGLFYNKKVPLPPTGRHSHAIDILLEFCPILGAKPELRGTLKFRDVENLNLKFAEGRGGAKPLLMFPDSRRPEKRWGGFKQLTELLLREDPTRKVVWAGSNPLARPERLPAGPVPQSRRQHEPRLAAGPDQAGRLGHHQRQRPDAPRGRPRRAGLRHLRPHRSAALRPVSAQRTDQFHHPGARRRPEAAHGEGRLRALSAHPDALGEGAVIV